jgi:hypothetical protein
VLRYLDEYLMDEEDKESMIQSQKIEEEKKIKDKNAVDI